MKKPSPSSRKSLADLVADLGGVPLKRIRAFPPPGTATEADVVRERRPCELIDGTLVERALWLKASILICELQRLLGDHVWGNHLGVLLGAGGTLRLSPRLVRSADVAFVSWDDVPGAEWPDGPIPKIRPTLAVEVFKPDNTPGEIRLKIREYFQAGTRLVWVIDPKKQNARAYTAPDSSRLVAKSGSLDGGEVLPGFRLPLPELFGSLKKAPA